MRWLVIVYRQVPRIRKVHSLSSDRILYQENAFYVERMHSIFREHILHWENTFCVLNRRGVSPDAARCFVYGEAGCADAIFHSFLGRLPLSLSLSLSLTHLFARARAHTHILSLARALSLSFARVRSLSLFLSRARSLTLCLGFPSRRDPRAC